MMNKPENRHLNHQAQNNTGSYYLGVDPGRDKTGVALVDASGAIVAVRVLRTRSFPDALARFLSETLQASNAWALRQKLRAVVIGNGTNSAAHAASVKQSLAGIPLYEIDEKNSTEEARALYWELFPPKGWRSLVPLGLQVPPEPLDGYAAVIQVRRFLEQENRMQE
ncbi:MAG: pre-16S rRNA-processing nuclease YqgF [Acidaminococcaceae bacterium]|nr:pre-16S rRNA-processing nuclease YqgF [Acidaminococcaceae bacterium]MBR1590005.1 pre-16S rRNA-processing nuclease YqgF [Acidaminococcaceae bacterium]